MATPVVKVTIDDDKIGLDCSITERHASTVELTRHAIEEGDDPVDHARKLPDRLSLDGLFSNTPVGKAEAEARGNTSVGASGYAQQQYGKLLELLKARRAVTIRTELRAYQNMVLVSLEVPRDSKIGDAIRFSATFEEIRFVKSELVRLELVTRPNTVPTKPIKKTEKGKQPMEPKPELEQSILKKGGDWLGITTPGSGL